MEKIDYFLRKKTLQNWSATSRRKTTQTPSKVSEESCPLSAQSQNSNLYIINTQNNFLTILPMQKALHNLTATRPIDIQSLWILNGIYLIYILTNNIQYEIFYMTIWEFKIVLRVLVLLPVTW